MRAVSISEGVDMEAIARAAAAEIKSYARGGGEPKDAFLVICVRNCTDEVKENGTGPQRGTRSR